MSDFGRLMELARQHVPEPAMVDAPAVTPATANVGDTLSCTMGNWTGEPTAYAYSWLADGTTEVGTAADYAVAPSDAGHSLTCVVTATNIVGSTVAPPSNAVAIAAAGGMAARGTTRAAPVDDDDGPPHRQTGASRERR